MSDQSTVAQELTKDERKVLDTKNLYLAMSYLPEREIELLFERFTNLQYPKFHSGDQKVRDETSQILKGIEYVKSMFLRIKKEQKALDK